MATSEKQMIPLEAIPQGDEGMVEFSAEDLVNVKFPSRPRRKVVIIVAVIAVVIIVTGVLIGTFVPNYLSDNDDANNKTEKGLKGQGIGEIEEKEEEESIPSPSGTIAEISSSASIFPTSSSRFHLSPVEMASVTTTCKNCNDFSLLMSSASLNERPSLSSMSYSIATGLESLSSMVLSSSLNEKPSLSSMSFSIETDPGSSLSSMVLSSSLNERLSLSSMSYSIDTHTTTIPGSALSSMAKPIPNAGTAKTLSSASISSTSSSQFHLSPVEMASVTTTCKTCNDFSIVLSSSLNERPSLSSMSYNIDPHTTTGPAASLSSIAKLVPNAEAKWSRWSSWSDCTKTCGNGTRFRTRKCEAQNQDAVFAPIFCAGKNQQNNTCADWGCPDCFKICAKGTLNAACDACTCENHVLTGRVQTKKNAPLPEAKISLAETPYNVLAQTNASGFFVAFNVCADANQELLIAREGFVPVEIKATIMTSTTASLSAKLDNAVPPSITVHPRSKMRISGHGVTFCCDGDGTPTPEFEWFKDNNIIDKDVYHYNKTLEISDVSGLKGRYRCRVVNDYGSEFSDVANLQVLNTSDEVSCNPTPISKNATLPASCVIYGTTNDTIDVGQCPPTPCLRNDSALSNTACQDENFCCVVDEVENVAITCGGSVTFNISKVARCGCQACEVPKSYITGVVVGVKGAVEKPIAYCEIIVGDQFYNADDKGSFTLEVPDDKQRLSVVFKDTFDEEYADVTKVFRIKTGQASFSKIVLKVKPAPKPFNASEPFKVPLGDSHGDSAFAEIEIPEDALLKEDGTIYTGQANLRLSLTDPRNVSDVITAPGDFSTIDEDGEEEMLVSYGMLRVNFEDDSGNKLSTSKSIKMFLDPEKLNISVDSNGNTTTKLWWLDEKTGRWIEAGSLWMETKETSRRKRSPTRFLVTEITPVIQNIGTLNVDVKEDFGAVRVSAPAGSTVRILCKEPNLSVEKYLGYLEEIVDGSRVACISVWISKTCFMQAEGSDSRFLNPSDPDSFPDPVSVSIVESELGRLGSSPSVKSFRFNIEPDSKGPVYPHYEERVVPQDCKASELISGHRQFEFALPAAPVNLNLISERPIKADLKDPLNWYPPGITVNCFIKILITGPKGSIFLASSYRANKTDEDNKFGDSVAMAEPATDIENAFVVCLEVRCPGKVYNEGVMVPEWTHVLVTHLTGNCDFQQNHLQKQEDLDNNGAKCHSRSKRHAAGSENWFCIPLPAGKFDIDKVYTAVRSDRQKGVNRCNVGDPKWASGKANPTSKFPTIEFSCS